jgi:hypothetical protein
MDDERPWAWSLDDPRLSGRPAEATMPTPDFTIEQLEAELREWIRERATG